MCVRAYACAPLVVVAMLVVMVVVGAAVLLEIYLRALSGIARVLANALICPSSWCAIVCVCVCVYIFIYAQLVFGSIAARFVRKLASIRKMQEMHSHQPLRSGFVSITITYLPIRSDHLRRIYLWPRMREDGVNDAMCPFQRVHDNSRTLCARFINVMA